MLKPITCNALKLDGINHAFFTRHGGASKGIYKGLNVGIGSNDDQEVVTKNRALASAHLNVPKTHLATPYQIHSAIAVVVSEPMTIKKPKADALVTKTKGLMVGVLTADCGPVLFADEKAGIVATAHAGWKGATSGILENTIQTMCNLGATPKNIIAILGPTISQENYEVGPEFADNLISLDKNNDAYLINSEQKTHFMFDLPQYIVDRLSNLDVQANWTGQCTYSNEDALFSYRRSTHRKEPDYGRQLSAICLI
ncbi:MAG: polyphenol oxidase [Hyphomicrobiales bacterium]|nr:peptidoglycan editing factor PgeF [Hyphomicrobiales bacterium]PCH51619.1 MAG: polyphenol oxidase [Hyphomicrobiales bacterium]